MIPAAEVHNIPIMPLSIGTSFEATPYVTPGVSCLGDAPYVKYYDEAVFLNHQSTLYHVYAFFHHNVNSFWRMNGLLLNYQTTLFHLYSCFNHNMIIFKIMKRLAFFSWIWSSCNRNRNTYEKAEFFIFFSVIWL